jgi:hypothetical protein
VNVWMKRAIGAAALGGSLLALGAGAASAQEVSADASARLGRPTSAEVRVCADGRVLSRLLGGCGGQSGTSATVRAGDGVQASARVPRLASAATSVGTRRSRAAAGASVTARPGAATADAAASLSRPRAGRLLDLLTLDDLAGEAPAGIGVLDSGPIADGNQAGAEVGDVSPSVPVTVCGNSVGVLGDASASCAPAQPAAGGGSSSESTGTSSGSGASATTGSLLDNLASGNQVDAGIGGISPSAPVTVCGNGVGALGDASVGCGTAQPSGGGGPTSPAGSGNQATVGTDGIAPPVPVTVCGNGVGLLGDASVGCGADTSTGGIIAPPPGTTPGSTDTDGIQGTPGSTGTSGIPGTTTGLTPGTGGGPGDPAITLAPLRPSVAGSLPFTGAASDLLALVAGGLLVAGTLIVRAARPATAATEGGEDR